MAAVLSCVNGVSVCVFGHDATLVARLRRFDHFGYTYSYHDYKITCERTQQLDFVLGAFQCSSQISTCSPCWVWPETLTCCGLRHGFKPGSLDDMFCLYSVLPGARSNSHCSQQEEHVGRHYGYWRDFGMFRWLLPARQWQGALHIFDRLNELSVAKDIISCLDGPF